MKKRIIALGVLIVAVLSLMGGSALAQAPIFPVNYSGTATVQGLAVPDGTELYAKVGTWDSRDLSQSTTVSGGTYSLAVGPPSTSYIGKTVEFYIDGIKAAETDTFPDTYDPDTNRFRTLNLTFPSLPATAAVYPVAYSGTATVEGLDVPDDTELYAVIGTWASPSTTVSAGSYSLVVTPTDRTFVGGTVEFYIDGVKAAETATLPDGFITASVTLDLTFASLPATAPLYAVTYSGTATVAETAVPDGTELYAKIGSWESAKTTVSEGSYSLVVTPTDRTFVGGTVEFYIDGVKAAETATLPDGYITASVTLNLTFPSLPAVGDVSLTLVMMGLAIVGALGLLSGIGLLRKRYARA